MTDPIDYGAPDGEAPAPERKTRSDRNPRPEELEPVVLPRKPLIPGAYGEGSIKGGKILQLTRKNEKALLEACSVSANMSSAVRRAGISMRRVSKVLGTNPALRERVQEHLDYAIDRLEQASLSRAIRGATVPVYGDAVETVDSETGEVQTSVPVIGKRAIPPSDRLAAKLLEGRRAEIYGRKGGEAGGARVLAVTVMSRDQLTQSAAKAIDSPEPLGIPAKSKG